MYPSRVRAALYDLRVARVSVFLAVVICAFFLAPSVFDQAERALSAERASSPGVLDDADDLGLGIGQTHSDSTVLFSILYNASSHGEMRPCPT